MSKKDFSRLITTFMQSQVGVRELGTRPMICVTGVFFPCVPELIELPSVPLDKIDENATVTDF